MVILLEWRHILASGHTRRHRQILSARVGKNRSDPPDRWTIDVREPHAGPVRCCSSACSREFCNGVACDRSIPSGKAFHREARRGASHHS